MIRAERRALAKDHKPVSKWWETTELKRSGLRRVQTREHQLQWKHVPYDGDEKTRTSFQRVYQSVFGTSF